MHGADYCYLSLVGRNGIRGYTIIDSADRQMLAAWRWTINDGYASRGYELPDGGVRVVLMHRVLLGLEYGDGLEGDHKNRDRLDNRRSNLRVVTSEENKQNRAAWPSASSRFRGVHWAADRGRWRAGSSIAGRTVSLGTFDSEIAAARAAETWRREHLPFAEPDAELVLLDRSADLGL